MLVKKVTNRPNNGKVFIVENPQGPSEQSPTTGMQQCNSNYGYFSGQIPANCSRLARSGLGRPRNLTGRAAILTQEQLSRTPTIIPLQLRRIQMTARYPHP